MVIYIDMVIFRCGPCGRLVTIWNRSLTYKFLNTPFLHEVKTVLKNEYKHRHPVRMNKVVQVIEHLIAGLFGMKFPTLLIKYTAKRDIIIRHG